jgi:DHA1 family multidrug resistance protein-like MFS transporter
MRSRFGWLREYSQVILLCVMVVLMMMGIGLVSPVMPQYARTFGVSIAMVGLLTTTFGLARLVVDLPVGRLTESLGRRPLLIAGPLVQAIGSVACGLAGSYGQLLAFRVVQGIGSSMYTTAAMIALADLSTSSNRGQVMSLYQGSLLLGAGLGPTLGGLLAQYLGLRAPFFVFGALATLAAVWGYLRLPETRSRPEEATASGQDSVHSGAHGSPASSTGLMPLLRNSNFLLVSMVTLGFFFMRTGARNQILPLLAHDRLGLNPGAIGVALTVASLMNFLTLMVAGRLSDRLGRKAVITPGCLITAVSLVMLTQSRSYEFMLLSCLVMGIGTGIAGPTPSAYVADIIPRENYSGGMSLYRAIGDLGFVIGPVFLGWLADIRGFDTPLLFTCLFLVVAASLFQAFAREPRRAETGRA